MKLLPKIAELEIKSVCVPGHGIEEPACAWCCQSNEALEKTEVGPYHKWPGSIFRQGELALSSIQGRVDSVFEWMLGSVILQPILSV